MSDLSLFRFQYPPCPPNLNEKQKIRKYQTLQYNSLYKNGTLTKAQKYKHAVTNNGKVTARRRTCSSYNSPTCSDVPGTTWDLVVTPEIINYKSIINNSNTIPGSGPTYF